MLVLVSVADEGLAALAGAAAAQTADALPADARQRSRRSRRWLHGPRCGPSRDPRCPCSSRRIEPVGATLVAVGTHDVSRAVGIFVHRVSTSLLHKAPCSVLVARR